MKYIVLLRGINISGKNKVPMNDLKKIPRKYRLHQRKDSSKFRKCYFRNQSIKI